MITKRVCRVGKLQLEDQGHNSFFVLADPGTTLEDVMKPEYWVHHARRVKIWDHLKVQAEDGEFYVELLVHAVTENSVFVKIIHVVEISDEVREEVSKEGFSVSWGGPQQKWRIVRNADGATINKGFPDRISAEEALANVTG